MDLIKVVVPELVIREVIGRFSDELRKRKDDVAKSAESLRRLIASPSEPMEVPITESVREYESFLRQTLAASKVEIVPLPKIDVSDIADRAIYRRRPFDEKGSGFRDSLVWTNFTDCLAESPTARAVLVSNDSKAFFDGDKSGLHADLVAEVRKGGFEGVVDLYQSIAGYLTDEDIGDAQIVAKVADEVVAQQVVLSALASKGLNGSELSSVGYPEVRAIVTESAEVTMILLKVSGVIADGSELLLVSFLVGAKAQIDLSIDDGRSLDNREVESTILIEASASYDPKSKSFADFEVEPPFVMNCPELISEIEAHRMIGTSMQDAVSQYLKMTGPIQLPEATLEQMRKMNTFQLPESMLENFRKMYSFQLPESVLENFRKMYSFQLPD
jgi:hypothetical protein